MRIGIRKLTALLSLCLLGLAGGCSSESPQPGESDNTLTATDTNSAMVVAAGRSPIPQEGELILKPIGPKSRSAIPEEGETLVKPLSGADAANQKVEGIIPWDQAKQYTGKIATVEGTIVQISDLGNRMYLNYRPYDREDPPSFYLIVFKENFAKFPPDPKSFFQDKRVRATGLIQPRGDASQIKLIQADQIEIVE